mgnify:FL=1
MTTEPEWSEAVMKWEKHFDDCYDFGLGKVDGVHFDATSIEKALAEKDEHALLNLADYFKQTADAYSKLSFSLAKAWDEIHASRQLDIGADE